LRARERTRARERARARARARARRQKKLYRLIFLHVLLEDWDLPLHTPPVRCFAILFRLQEHLVLHLHSFLH